MEPMEPIHSSGRECFAYSGDREGWLKFLGQHRDSDALQRSNFRSALRALGGEDDEAGIAVERFNHWAVGWTEVLLIRPDAAEKIAQADAIRADLEGYPVVDEDDFSTLEWEEACEYWAQESVRARLQLLEGTGISPFAARRAELPEDPAGRLFERLTS